MNHSVTLKFENHKSNIKWSHNFIVDFSIFSWNFSFWKMKNSIHWGKNTTVCKQQCHNLDIKSSSGLFSVYDQTKTSVCVKLCFLHFVMKSFFKHRITFLSFLSYVFFCWGRIRSSFPRLWKSNFRHWSRNCRRNAFGRVSSPKQCQCSTTSLIYFGLQPSCDSNFGCICFFIRENGGRRKWRSSYGYVRWR